MVPRPWVGWSQPDPPRKLMNYPALFPAESNIWNNWNVIHKFFYQYILDVPKITVAGILTSQWNVRRIICFFSKKFADFDAGFHLEPKVLATKSHMTYFYHFPAENFSRGKIVVNCNVTLILSSGDDQLLFFDANCHILTGGFFSPSATITCIWVAVPSPRPQDAGARPKPPVFPTKIRFNPTTLFICYHICYLPKNQPKCSEWSIMR